MKTPLIISGTTTGIGKTLVSAILMSGTRCSYWKPIQSGTIEGTDTEWIRRQTGLHSSRFFPEAYRFTQPLSPHLAADIDSMTIDPERVLTVPHSDDGLIIEGAGGLLVPITWSWLQIDYFSELGFPVILVSGTQLGTINHTLLSIEALKSRKIPVAGIIFSGDWNEGNDRSIRHFSEVPVLGWVPPLSEPFTPGILSTVYRQHFDHSFFGAYESVD